MKRNYKTALSIARNRKRYAGGGDVEDADPNLSLTKGSATGGNFFSDFGTAFMKGLPESGAAGLEGIESALSGFYKPENAVGMNDANQWTDAQGNPIAPTRRPNVLPVTKAPPSGSMDPVSAGTGDGLEAAMPSILDVANTVGNPFAPAKGMTLGAGITRQAPKAAAEKIAPPFYSAVDRAVETLPQPKASGDQWLATLKNQPGVKPEELEWMGVPEFLKEKNGPVTKQELQDFVRGNQVELKEITKGDINGPNYLSASDANPDKPKFQSYQLPGGENYRELLLTLPEKGRSAKDTAANRVREISKRTEEIQDEFDALDKMPESADLAAKRLALYNEQTSLKEEWKEQHRIATEPDKNKFTSSHWDEPNVLAHARMNDRQIDGGKSLFVEEIQSDWHQKGRKDGYSKNIDLKSVSKQRDEARANLNKIVKDNDQLGFDSNSQASREVISGGADRWEWNTPEEAARAQKLVDEIRAADTTIVDSKKGVPDAPFKTTWPELTLKRLVREAAEKGYDSISWTPGKVQADRYDLSHQIDSIAYRKDGDGTWEISAIKDGNSVITKYGQTANQLEEVIGKDVAKKIVDDEGKVADDFRGKNGGVKELSGIDLKVGGEGMAGFYDKILPSTANKLFKKYGAKVDQVSMGDPNITVRQHSPGRFALHNTETGDYIRKNSVGGSYDSIIDYPSKEEAFAAANKMGEKIHTMKITPELKAAALGEGFPMFSKAPLGGLAQDKVQERKDGGKVSDATKHALSVVRRANGGAVNTSPSIAQKEAGNYKKGHVNFQGLDITVENPKGSERNGIGADGKKWSCKMPDHYGYIKRTTGADGDHVDVYLGPDSNSEKVYVIDQINHDTKKFDEHKAMLGYPSKDAALACYRKAFSDGKADARIGHVTELGMDAFKAWLKGNGGKKPMGFAGGTMKFANGGGVPSGFARQQSITAQKGMGFLNSPVGGRTDHLPTVVPAGSYVLPADFVSSMGEGNSLAGQKRIGQMFGPTGLYGMKIRAGKGARGGFPSAAKAKFAHGGDVKNHVPILAAGGEYILHPDMVSAIGDGDMDAGHKALDKWVVDQRKKTVKTLKNLPGPAK